ncbi:PR5-like receptor kinase [Arachis hypogaea]|uniref:PR5-like receptor kinase n=1 Tax=Arachis hypogaea TaxID=3818 RepID=UPI003B20CCAB
MTNLFCEKLEQGRYGIVYKGNLNDGSQVAVKILKKSKGSVEEFVNEVVTISRTSHVNIVSLWGFCYEMNKQTLIYEFMSNGSLDKYKYKHGRSSLSSLFSNLHWKELYNIVNSIAQGLDYLHERCNTKILYLDIKPQNVLLDEKFCPKIADFGLAKICKNNKSSRRTFSIRGTPGYIAPEMFNRRAYGGISCKSDVYSYGMLILEMMGAKDDPHIRRSHNSESYFPDWLYKDQDEDFIYYRSFAFDKDDEIIIQKILLVGLHCIQTDPSKRRARIRYAGFL